jgi:ABC-type sugar transport system permease subunit
MPQEHRRALKRTLVFGVVSVVLYLLLYLGADLILEYSKQGRWFFIIPIGIAFIFSIMHGNFTSHFWDLFGVKAKTVKK